MKVTCQSCQARYTIADEKVRGKVAKIRCKKCGTTILVDGTDGAGSSASEAPVSAAAAVEAAPLAAEADMMASPEPVPAAKPVAPAPEPVALRRPGRAASTDLFGGARQEEVIATSAPATPSLPHVSEAGTEKLTGARNENSVLFSLSALTSGNNGPPVPGPDSMPSSRTADLRSLIGPNAGTTAPSKDKSKLDDIMNLGGGGLYSPALISPALAPPPLELSVSAEEASRAPKGKGRWFGIAAAVVLLGGGAAFAMMRSGDKTPTSTMGSPAPSAMVAAQAITAAPAEPAPTATASAAPAESATAIAAVAAQPAPEPTPTAVAPGQLPVPKPEPEKKAAPAPVAASPRVEKAAPAEKPAVAVVPAPAPAPPPPAVTQAALTGLASGEFDRAAAGSILSSTATAAQSCKKPDGPTGSGRVAVTFGNNGIATTATIEGPPFAGTAVGGCIAGRFRATRIPPFAGSPVTVHKSFFIN